jgi:hypothetical protein
MKDAHFSASIKPVPTSSGSAAADADAAGGKKALAVIDRRRAYSGLNKAA